MFSATQSLTLVAAMGRNREIGYRGGMPWHLPRDLQHFKTITLGHAVIMGRKTWESLPYALPGRLNLVITRQAAYIATGATVVHSLEDACKQAEMHAADNELMIIGGAELYRYCLPYSSKMQLTMIDTEPEADTWFPKWHPDEWQCITEQHYDADEKNAYAVTFIEMQRKLDALLP